MKTENKAIKLKGVKTPNFKEPKGTAYYELINRLRVEFIEKKSEVSQARTAFDRKETEIRALEQKINSEEETGSKFILKRKISELKKLIKQLEEKAYQDLDKIKENILNNEDVAIARAEAIEENKVINQEVKEYQKQLEKAYQATMKDIQRFTADYQSESQFKQADVFLNRLKG